MVYHYQHVAMDDGLHGNNDTTILSGETPDPVHCVSGGGGEHSISIDKHLHKRLTPGSRVREKERELVEFVHVHQRT